MSCLSTFTFCDGWSLFSMTELPMCMGCDRRGYRSRAGPRRMAAGQEGPPGGVALRSLPTKQVRPHCQTVGQLIACHPAGGVASRPLRPQQVRPHCQTVRQLTGCHPAGGVALCLLATQQVRPLCQIVRQMTDCYLEFSTYPAGSATELVRNSLNHTVCQAGHI